MNFFILMTIACLFMLVDALPQFSETVEYEIGGHTETPPIPIAHIDSIPVYPFSQLTKWDQSKGFPDLFIVDKAEEGDSKILFDELAQKVKEEGAIRSWRDDIEQPLRIVDNNLLKSKGVNLILPKPMQGPPDAFNLWNVAPDWKRRPAGAIFHIDNSPNTYPRPDESTTIILQVVGARKAFFYEVETAQAAIEVAIKHGLPFPCVESVKDIVHSNCINDMRDVLLMHEFYEKTLPVLKNEGLGPIEVEVEAGQMLVFNQRLMHGTLDVDAAAFSAILTFHQFENHKPVSVVTRIGHVKEQRGPTDFSRIAVPSLIDGSRVFPVSRGSTLKSRAIYPLQQLRPASRVRLQRPMEVRPNVGPAPRQMMKF